MQTRTLAGIGRRGIVYAARLLAFFWCALLVALDILGGYEERGPTYNFDVLLILLVVTGLPAVGTALVALRWEFFGAMLLLAEGLGLLALLWYSHGLEVFGPLVAMPLLAGALFLVHRAIAARVSTETT